MLLLVPAHPGCPGQIPQSRKTVVCVCSSSSVVSRVVLYCAWCICVSVCVAVSVVGVAVIVSAVVVLLIGVVIIVVIILCRRSQSPSYYSSLLSY